MTDNVQKYLFQLTCLGGTVTMIIRNCVHRSSPNWVCR